TGGVEPGPVGRQGQAVDPPVGTGPPGGVSAAGGGQGGQVGRAATTDAGEVAAGEDPAVGGGGQGPDGVVGAGGEVGPQGAGSGIDGGQVGPDGAAEGGERAAADPGDAGPGRLRHDDGPDRLVGVGIPGADRPVGHDPGRILAGLVANAGEQPADVPAAGAVGNSGEDRPIHRGERGGPGSGGG